MKKTEGSLFDIEDKKEEQAHGGHPLGELIKKIQGKEKRGGEGNALFFPVYDNTPESVYAPKRKGDSGYVKSQALTASAMRFGEYLFQWMQGHPVLSGAIGEMVREVDSDLRIFATKNNLDPARREDYFLIKVYAESSIEERIRDAIYEMGPLSIDPDSLFAIISKSNPQIARDIEAIDESGKKYIRLDRLVEFLDTVQASAKWQFSKRRIEYAMGRPVVRHYSSQGVMIPMLSFVFEDGAPFRTIHELRAASAKNKIGYVKSIELSLHPETIASMLNPLSRSVLLDTRTRENFDSVYLFRIDSLAAYLRNHKEFKRRYTLDDLNAFFGTSYKTVSHIYNKVVKPGAEKWNERNPKGERFSVTPVKEGRKIVALDMELIQPNPTVLAVVERNIVRDFSLEHLIASQHYYHCGNSLLGEEPYPFSFEEYRAEVRQAIFQLGGSGRIAGENDLTISEWRALHASEKRSWKELIHVLENHPDWAIARGGKLDGDRLCLVSADTKNKETLLDQEGKPMTLPSHVLKEYYRTTREEGRGNV